MISIDPEEPLEEEALAVELAAWVIARCLVHQRTEKDLALALMRAAGFFIEGGFPPMEEVFAEEGYLERVVAFTSFQIDEEDSLHRNLTRWILEFASYVASPGGSEG